MSFCDWLISQHNVLRVHPCLAGTRVPFLFKAEERPLCDAIHCVSPSSAGGHLGGFPVLATVNNAAVNVDGQCLRTLFSVL